MQQWKKCPDVGVLDVLVAISLLAFVEHKHLMVVIHSLHDSTPLAEVEYEILPVVLVVEDEVQ